MVSAITIKDCLTPLRIKQFSKAGPSSQPMTDKNQGCARYACDGRYRAHPPSLRTTGAKLSLYVRSLVTS
ncbi:uncharacterized protein PHALS_09364 [Plasmopara halstedii]|uniref:Uncharacterized protein n=1 Tax=Plasmopara halstedii TaxID=4781 RepID=A0A0N7L4Q3_PLAHL|nr:uncharacterized protein PHALS_09364 [Plasmopara halstedii]CEG39315.1 hypothetical protein PHALS_09364 [Plasmopara halstedii]|eukprot:XP_024575684.1 hypothetical protein PHALS_09364 [Plasmopara halstedii]